MISHQFSGAARRLLRWGELGEAQANRGFSVQGLMQNQPLLLSSLLRHAERFHAQTEIVSRTVEGPIHRYGYGDAARRARKLADALRQFGVKQGDRVATLAWNTYRHFEIEHGVTGLGAVWHAINPRLVRIGGKISF